MMNVTTEQFAFIVRILRTHSGMKLGDNNAHLLESRLKPLARAHNYESIAGLVSALQQDSNHPAMAQLVDAMNTHESMFFRDGKPFDYLRQYVVPYLQKKNEDNKTIAIWSAACAGGQEPYSIAICLKEMVESLAAWQCTIYATDMSQQVIEKAKAGTYSQFEVSRGLSDDMLATYFNAHAKDKWQVKHTLKAMVDFTVANILDAPLPGVAQFDCVFCRNLLIYCDDDIKRRILENIAYVMPQGAILFLGSSETILGICEDLFAPYRDCRGVFMRR